MMMLWTRSERDDFRRVRFYFRWCHGGKRAARVEVG
eukprot:CAMPEP_0177689902 /NCGR_PEP_ID=MMETSP0484_2-20121128/458_1 /TAXON_ID=354590 /ORGANISM="Rhodomonas lens, Strain RHODO" /LENGTH=35 /DNA_ID= /DNA_START= /DNA_END= /DNA_ORIENTATION=